MILTAGHVTELVREIAPLVQGLVVREVLARPPRDVLLVFAAKGDLDGPPAWRVLVSADGDAPRIHVQRGRFERHAGPLGPFFRRLVGEFAGLELAALKQVGDDRIVAFETRGNQHRTLVAELVGRHGNLVLLGPDERVLDVLVPPPADKENPRLSAGKLYVAPPGRAVKPTDPNAGLATEFAAPAESAPLRKHEDSNAAPLSWLVENGLGAQADAARIGRERRGLTDRLERKHKNAKALVAGLERRATESAGFERVQQDGELVKAHLNAIARGAKSIQVEDFFASDAALRTIALDPKLSAHENLARIFERAKKLERAGLVVHEELDIARTKLAAIERYLELARQDGADFEALAAAAVEERVLEPEQDASLAKKKHEVAPRLPYKIFHSEAGSEIRVGRNAKDNDDLTFRHASGNDVWLHTADVPGSHVVLRIGKTHEASPEDLLDAAHLAAHFSPHKDATRVRVHVARRKEVHKPRGAKAGLVTLSGGKILDVRMQPERLKRLLGTHRAPGSGP